jgi:hypothetical protein
LTCDTSGLRATFINVTNPTTGIDVRRYFITRHFLITDSHANDELRGAKSNESRLRHDLGGYPLAGVYGPNGFVTDDGLFNNRGNPIVVASPSVSSQSPLVSTFTPGITSVRIFLVVGDRVMMVDEVGGGRSFPGGSIRETFTTLSGQQQIRIRHPVEVAYRELLEEVYSTDGTQLARVKDLSQKRLFVEVRDKNLSIQCIAVSSNTMYVLMRGPISTNPLVYNLDHGEIASRRGVDIRNIYNSLTNGRYTRRTAENAAILLDMLV